MGLWPVQRIVELNVAFCVHICSIWWCFPKDRCICFWSCPLWTNIWQGSYVLSRQMNMFLNQWDLLLWLFTIPEEDKIWDKAWWAQQAHVHGPIKVQAHSLCGAPDRTRAQTCLPRFRFLKTCSARKGLGPQGQDLSYKEKTCSTRRRLALQGEDLLCKKKSKCLTTIKAPTSSSHKRYVWLTSL